MNGDAIQEVYEAAEATRHVHEAASIPAQQRIYLELQLAEIRDELQEQAADRVSRTARGGQVAALRILKTLAPMIERLAATLLDASGRQAALVRAALGLWDHRQHNERLWQMSLVALRQQLRNVESVRKAVLALRPSGITAATVRRTLWPAQLEERYRAVDEDLDDLMETLALGLSAEMRAKIDAGLSSGQPS